MINRVGSTFVHRLMETTGAKPHEIVRAYLLTREIFGFVAVWQSIEALDNRSTTRCSPRCSSTSDAESSAARPGSCGSRALADDMGPTIEYFTPQSEGAGREVCGWLDPGDQARMNQTIAEYVRPQRAVRDRRRGRESDALYPALDITEVATRAPSARDRREVYFDVSARLACRGCAKRSRRCRGHPALQTLAKGAMLDDVYACSARSRAKCCRHGTRSAAGS
jgi:glutamate dehydrogenase